jgi:hypothetical protein
MAKGFFTQGVSLRTNGQTTIANIKAALRQQGFDLVKESTAQGPPSSVPSTRTLQLRQGDL